MEFFNKVGKTAIGSRLRMLTEMITADAAQIYQLYNISMQPKWFPVFYVLSGGEEKTITAIAKEIGHSHPSVSKIIGEMIKAGLVTEKKDVTDGRRNLVRLSEKGKEITLKIEDQYTDVGNAIEELSSQASHNLWKAIEEWEYLLEQKTLLQRVKEQRKQRTARHIHIIDYKPEYKAAFKKLNEEWISKYFKMEEADYKALDHPEEYILNKGGRILIALYQNEPVGVCALLKMNHFLFDYELAKMAVSPKMHGKNIGYTLGMAALNTARNLGAKTVYLESNTILKPAINLYHKLGFKKVSGESSPYERCNIQMSVDL
jgi:DNA-binding MarR family transcriptional regulator/N-acetylglutamate synthase-like GNAT family acetyltransferase